MEPREVGMVMVEHDPWSIRMVAGIAAVHGVRDILTGARPLLLWPVSDPPAGAYLNVTAGILSLVLAVALWRRRGIRVVLFPTLTAIVIATIFNHYDVMVSRGTDPASPAAMILWVVLGAFTLGVTAIGRWMWRLGSGAAP